MRKTNAVRKISEPDANDQMRSFHNSLGRVRYGYLGAFDNLPSHYVALESILPLPSQFSTLRVKSDSERSRKYAVRRLSRLLYSIGTSDLDQQTQTRCVRKIYAELMGSLSIQLRVEPQYERKTRGGVPLFWGREKVSLPGDFKDLEGYFRYPKSDFHYVKSIIGSARNGQIRFDIPEFTYHESESDPILCVARSPSEAKTYELGLTIEPSLQERAGIVCAYDTIFSQAAYSRLMSEAGETSSTLADQRKSRDHVIRSFMKLNPQQDPIAREKMLAVGLAIKSYLDNSDLPLAKLLHFIGNVYTMITQLPFSNDPEVSSR
ncbi:hypothetical protein HY990_04605 [Candidatus Micrarchaeota archaeon]|nr:hypothetical protein [Candidatus Micrarchaeota archaeon]